LTHLLDTNTCVAFLRGKNREVADHMAALSQREVVLCSVVKAELYFGARQSAFPERSLQTLSEFFKGFDSLPFDDSAAEIYGSLRRELAQTGRMIGPNDLLIASIAISRDFILVTHNTAEFSRVEGLRIDDWESGP